MNIRLVVYIHQTSCFVWELDRLKLNLLDWLKCAETMVRIVVSQQDVALKAVMIIIDYQHIIAFLMALDWQSMRIDDSYTSYTILLFDHVLCYSQYSSLLLLLFVGLTFFFWSFATYWK